jgi:hypothetical protein
MLYLHNAKFKIDYFYEHMWLVFPVICKSISFYFVCFYRCLYFTGFYLGWYSCMCVFMYVSKHVSSIYHMSLYPCIIYYLSIYLSIIYHLSPYLSIYISVIDKLLILNYGIFSHIKLPSIKVQMYKWTRGYMINSLMDFISSYRFSF